MPSILAVFVIQKAIVMQAFLVCSRGKVQRGHGTILDVQVNHHISSGLFSPSFIFTDQIQENNVPPNFLCLNIGLNSNRPKPPSSSPQPCKYSADA